MGGAVAQLGGGRVVGRDVVMECVGQEPALSNITIGIGMQEPAQTTNSLILPFMDFC